MMFWTNPGLVRLTCQSRDQSHGLNYLIVLVFEIYFYIIKRNKNRCAQEND